MFRIPEWVDHVYRGSWEKWGVNPYVLTEVIVPGTVSHIMATAFTDCINMRKITLQSGVIAIGGDAFAGCDSLEEILIPDTVLSIGSAAFWHCSALKRIDIPPRIEMIGALSFGSCVALETVTIPNGVKLIGERAFELCRALKTVTIPPKIERIKQSAFHYCEALVMATVPLARMIEIAPYAFNECHKDLVIVLGELGDPDLANFFPAINGIARTATIERTLPKELGTYIARYDWPASTENLTRNDPLRFLLPPVGNYYDQRVAARNEYFNGGFQGDLFGYQPTDSFPPILVDGSGIGPVRLQDPSGNIYWIYGCWGKDPVADPDFKELAKQQYPELGDDWVVTIHKSWNEPGALDLEELGNMLVRGTYDLDTPVALIWTEPDEHDSVDSVTNNPDLLNLENNAEDAAEPMQRSGSIVMHSRNGGLAQLSNRGEPDEISGWESRPAAGGKPSRVSGSKELQSERIRHIKEGINLVIQRQIDKKRAEIEDVRTTKKYGRNAANRLTSSSIKHNTEVDRQVLTKYTEIEDLRAAKQTIPSTESISRDIKEVVLVPSSNGGEPDKSSGWASRPAAGGKPSGVSGSKEPQSERMRRLKEQYNLGIQRRINKKEAEIKRLHATKRKGSDPANTMHNTEVDKQIDIKDTEVAKLRTVITTNAAA